MRYLKYSLLLVLSIALLGSAAYVPMAHAQDSGDPLAPADPLAEEPKEKDPNDPLELRKKEVLTNIKRLEKAVRDYPGDAFLFYELAQAYQEGMFYQYAKDTYVEAISRNPELKEAYVDCASLEFRTGNQSDAEALLVSARERFPEFGPVYTNLGRIYQEQGRTNEALAAYAEGFKFSPDDAGASFNYGNLLVASGDYAKAKDAFQAVLKQNKDDVEAMINLGVTLLELEDTEGAFETYLAALAIAPERPEPYMNLAQLHLRQGDKESAASMLRIYVSQDSTSSEGIIARALIRKIEAGSN
ncbi:MAG: tetratricopeptide repeat protein [Candidatus Eisenbacteria bacterium]|uniref:Tetratricopeptide repeat protein n=1 Tax=Eiseniibacteriota bacterium TaxID=2212470 RepID=A0A7Y2EE55_UNCEI|nr:tetratricopeptide repeat protein [Candidatus Eisenbacteria bacterium]